MNIFDFRMRPPYGSFLNLGIYSPVCNEAMPMKTHSVPSPSAREKSLDLFWKEQDAAGITKGIAMGRLVPDDLSSVTNDDIHALAKAYPDRVVPFGGLDVSRGVAATLDELERCLELGFKGFAMEPAYCLPPRFADANVLYPIYARCEKAGVPVVLTMSVYQGTLEHSNPVAAQRVAEDFPNLQLVLAHACYPWIPHVFNLCLVCSNVWLIPDLYMMHPYAPGNDMYAQAMRWLDGERLLFATAYPCYNIEQAVRDVKRFGFSDEHLEKFFHGNAEKLLGSDVVNGRQA